MTHDIKVSPNELKAVLAGARTVTRSSGDRPDFGLGDLISLLEYDGRPARFTGRHIVARVVGVAVTQRYGETCITFGEPIEDRP